MANQTLSQQTSPHFLLHQPKSRSPTSTVASPHLFYPSCVLDIEFYSCVQVRVCLCRGIMCVESTHAHACGDQRPISSVVPQERAALFSETGSLAGLELAHVGGHWMSPSDLQTCLHFPRAVITGTSYHPHLFGMGSGD